MAITAAELYWVLLRKENHVILFAPLTLQVDNFGALPLASNPVFNAKTKHIELNYHFICEQIVNIEISLPVIFLLQWINLQIFLLKASPLHSFSWYGTNS
jgi:hypothetical protein